MIHFDKTVFGAVYINGQRYGDVLIVGDKIKPRDKERLTREIGDHHQVGDFEVDELLTNKPEIIIIGNGQSGVLEVNDRVRERINKAGAELKILLTPEAIEEFNRFTKEEKKVNCLIHTTC